MKNLSSDDHSFEKKSREVGRGILVVGNIESSSTPFNIKCRYLRKVPHFVLDTSLPNYGVPPITFVVQQVVERVVPR
ncbi:hypothetical protein SAMN05216332_1068 [Nitrosospira briensis]|nr:hypothetical protein SAMN05216332_1068 [Nitrosospira briensis]